MSTKFGFDLSAESWDADYAQVWDDGVYTVNEPHLPGGFTRLGFINNRAFIYHMKTPELGEHFLMSGIPGHGCIDKVKKLEADKGISLKVVITSGDYHHMAMKSWLEAYPQAKFVHSSLKFPQTRNGASILGDAKFKSQIELTDGETFPAFLKQYSDTLQFFGFNKCLTLGDKEYMSVDSKNHTKNQGLSYLKNVAGETADVKFLCIWTYHVPSKTLVFEHNFQMYINRELKKDMTLLGKLAVPTEFFGSVGKSPFPKLPSDKEDAEAHCQQMAAVLELDVRAMVEYHCGCGHLVREWPSRDEYQKELKAVLHKTGEDDPTGEELVEYMASSPYLCC